MTANQLVVIWIQTVNSHFTEKLLQIPGPMNLWNLPKFRIPTLGNWMIPQILQRIQGFLDNHPPQILLGTSQKSDDHLLKSALSRSEYMINSDSWSALAWTEYSYLKSANLRSQTAPITTVGGELDVITSLDGLLDWWSARIADEPVQQRTLSANLTYRFQREKPKRDDFYQVGGGGHLLVLTHPTETYDILHQYLGRSDTT